MRIAVSLGGKLQYTASLDGAGFLSAHLNLAHRPKESLTKRVIRVQGYDTNSPTETVSLSWPELKLDVGDTVQLEILGEGPGDAPAQRRNSTESPTNLLSNTAVAKELLDACQHFENRLLEIMKNASTLEPEEEHRKLKRAIGDVLVDLGEHLLSPIYRRHAELIPEPMKGELLW
jgi:hypothetical protein